MTQQITDSRAQSSGRERVLNAAISCFSRNLYSEVSLRDLAAVAEVDVAYVHRAYGSKSELFRAALTSLMEADALFVQPCTCEEMIDRMSATLAPDLSGSRPQARVLDLVLQSCTSEEPKEILREAVEQQFMGPLADVFGEEEKLAASFCISLLLGVGILREALVIEPIASLPPERVRDMCREILRRIIASDLPKG